MITKRTHALLPLLFFATAGCSVASSGVGNGELQIRFALPDGISLSGVNWQVVSSTDVVLASGWVGAPDPGSSPSLSLSVPQGAGERLTLSATTSAGGGCTGTGPPFNVIPGQISTIDVDLTCAPGPPDSGLGTVVITGVLVTSDSCPALNAWGISTQQSASGTEFDLTVTATDADPGDILTYTWSAPDGSFIDPSLAQTSYVCGSSGSESITLEISDNHQPDPCDLILSFPPVQCP